MLLNARTCETFDVFNLHPKAIVDWSFLFEGEEAESRCLLGSVHNGKESPSNRVLSLRTLSVIEVAISVTIN